MIVKAWGQSYRVKMAVDQYVTNKNLALPMWCEDGPFATLTVNLNEKLPGNQAYVDVNNCPWASEFIAVNGIGRFTGKIGFSGWCEYPLYEFDLDKIKEAL